MNPPGESKRIPLPLGSFVFCERDRMVNICRNVDGIRIESTEVKLEGYQIYLVEQWAIERNREVATAVSFTGDPVHKIQVVAITIEHQDVHCPRLERVFEKLRSDGARPKETPYGQLFVTNLSLFTSTLNIVLVPQQGDFDLYQRRFYLNLNLRRMGCSGRSALTSKSPSDAQREKFNQLYKISDSTDFEDTVIRLVDLVQNCLYIFGLFRLEDVDGLLCNATEFGLEEFYHAFLSTKFQKPSTRENVLDPNVLAGMFSKVANIRGKLQHLVSNVPKDPFAEPAAFASAVRAFQAKKPDLKNAENGGYLDFKTAEAITNAYQNSFNPQGLKVHKVLKSKIEDFSGMTAVNPEGETTDLEVFAKHIHSESLKLVWRGKPKHKPDMADALANGDWLTGGKELGKSLVRGLAKTTRETKNASQSLKTMATGKNRQSLLLPKGKSPINMKEGNMTEDTLVSSTPLDHNSPRSDDEKGDGYESDDGMLPSTVTPSVTNGPGSEDDLPPKYLTDAQQQQLQQIQQQQPQSAQQQQSGQGQVQQQQPLSAGLTNSATVMSATTTSSTTSTGAALDALSALFTQKPEPIGEPEIVKFYLDDRFKSSGPPMSPSHTALATAASTTATNASLSTPISAPAELVRSPSGSPAIPSTTTVGGATTGTGSIPSGTGPTSGTGATSISPSRPAGDNRKRAQSLSGLLGQERLLGCRLETTEPTGSIPGIHCLPYRKIDPHPARRKRTRSFACHDLNDENLQPLRSLVVECDTQRYYSYVTLKEKEDTLKNLYDKMQTIEKEFSGQLEALKTILKERSTQFEELDVEANAILSERRALLSEVREKEHATQRSVYHLDGMVGKLVEMRDFTGAFFNKISYLDTKLPVSQRRLALWMDKLQALQSQWFRTIGRYMIVYAPVGIRSRFVEWERDVQASALKATELRGEVGDIQLDGSSSSLVGGPVGTGGMGGGGGAVSGSSTCVSTAPAGQTVIQRSLIPTLPNDASGGAGSNMGEGSIGFKAGSYMVLPEAMRPQAEVTDKASGVA
ncbi:hypothetical protein BGZ83_000584 [Gryganskiella cystojenkinii]|nr:hypothetical protein BGZ83_000584 [Gryganskiella cystojenkinii]